MARTGGLILSGGRSSRMGYDKFHLRFPGEPLWQRVVNRMQRVASPVVLSLAAGGHPPIGLSDQVETVFDHDLERGPLWGLAAGFRALSGRCDQVVVIPVDVPFFTEKWLQRLIDGLASGEGKMACLYKWEGYANALTGAYRMDLLPKLEGMIEAGQSRPMGLIQDEPVEILEVESLWKPDQEPPPLMDMDTMEDYRKALLMEGVGNSQGTAITVEIQTHDPSEMVSPPVAMFARNEADVRQALAQLFPVSPESLLLSFKDGETVSSEDKLKDGAVLVWKQTQSVSER